MSFVLSKGINVDGSELVNGIKSLLPDSVVITGGLAGDCGRFEKTWVIANREMEENSVSALGLYGHRVQISYGSGHGWDGLEIHYKVTRSNKNVLYELDGKPAWEVYKPYLSDYPSSNIRFLYPFGIIDKTSEENPVFNTNDPEN